MTVQIGRLYRKRTVRSLDGSIREMVDQTGPGVIIKDYQVVNQDAINEMAKKEDDRRLAAVAETVKVEVPPEVAEIRAQTPTKLQDMEKKMQETDTKLKEVDSKLDLILKALQK